MNVRSIRVETARDTVIDIRGVEPTLWIVQDHHHRPGKRLFDLALVALAAVPAALIVALCAAYVVVRSPGNPFYRSKRISHRGGYFDAWKIRTMVPDADARLEHDLAADPLLAEEYRVFGKLRHDPRIIPGTRWLRVFSLDELPQLWNVVVGDMSLVGPRPKIPPDREAYGDALWRILSVRPGLTGLWQVSGRSLLPISRQVELDLEYVRTRSFAKDLSILARTVLQLPQPTRHGAVGPDGRAESVMPEPEPVHVERRSA